MSQDDFSAIGGVKRVAQYFYEIGSRTPTLDYLLRIQDAGVDLEFVLNGTTTGRRAPPTVFTESAVNEIVESVVSHTSGGKFLPEAERRKLVGALYRARIMQVEERRYADDSDVVAQGV